MDEETFSLLRELQCDAVQGYLIHRPADACSLGAWLREAPVSGSSAQPRPLLAGPLGSRTARLSA
jgi:hypothetical protein